MATIVTVVIPAVETTLVATNQPKLVAAAVAVITVVMLVESVVKVALEVAVMLVNVLDCHYSCYNSYFSDSCNCSYGSYCFN